MKRASIRHLVLVLGDQLDRHSTAWDEFDANQDRAWMCEAREEARHVPSAKQRLVVFISAMRHFAQDLRDDGIPLDYLRGQESLAQGLGDTLRSTSVQKVIVVQPGEWRVQQTLQRVCEQASVALEIREDAHFFCSRAEFVRHAQQRKQLRMEFFYRDMRRQHRVLMEGDEPVGGQWNFDSDNRRSFGAQGPGWLVPPRRFEPDSITQEVIEEVGHAYADAPGLLKKFGWPVTRAQALEALHDFVEHRLPEFGPWQDAMWAGEPWLHHAMISSSLNLKLLNPREVVTAVEQAWRESRVALASAEGFIRQVLGWREYVRGVYWLHMPDYLKRNALGADQPLPQWYWTGNTHMACLADALNQTLRHGYAHHIQRLMVTGLYALMLGVNPREVHAWYLSVYVDAVEWVELPNTLGMSQYGDGGVMASKPYVATGQYIHRMSNYCAGCRFDPAQRTGDRACPFTTLYWDFLHRHRDLLQRNPRMSLQVKNLARIDAATLQSIQDRARQLRSDPSLTSPPGAEGTHR